MDNLISLLLTLVFGLVIILVTVKDFYPDVWMKTFNQKAYETQQKIKQDIKDIRNQVRELSNK